MPAYGPGTQLRVALPGKRSHSGHRFTDAVVVSSSSPDSAVDSIRYKLRLAGDTADVTTAILATQVGAVGNISSKPRAGSLVLAKSDAEKSADGAGAGESGSGASSACCPHYLTMRKRRKNGSHFFIPVPDVKPEAAAFERDCVVEAWSGPGDPADAKSGQGEWLAATVVQLVVATMHGNVLRREYVIRWAHRRQDQADTVPRYRLRLPGGLLSAPVAPPEVASMADMIAFNEAALEQSSVEGKAAHAAELRRLKAEKADYTDQEKAKHRTKEKAKKRKEEAKLTPAQKKRAEKRKAAQEAYAAKEAGSTGGAPAAD